MPYKVYSDSYLMSLTKKQLIEILRTAEHNFKTIEEALNNSARVGKEYADKFDEAKRLLKLSLEQNNPKCKYCIHDLEEEQPHYNPCCTGETANCKWIYADEAEKLLKEN